MCTVVPYKYIGTWTKNIFDTTLAQYKVMCTKWFLGTGGGDGRSTMFEAWDDEKLQKYNVTEDTYDHTDIRSRPSILINNYHTHRQPFLTMIFLWDEQVSFLLSSKYEALKAGTGEAGMPKVGDEDIDSDDDEDGTKGYPPPTKRRF